MSELEAALGEIPYKRLLTKAKSARIFGIWFGDLSTEDLLVALVHAHEKHQKERRQIKSSSLPLGRLQGHVQAAEET